MYLFHLRHRLGPMVKRLTWWPFETYDLPKGNHPQDGVPFVGDGTWHTTTNESLQHFIRIGDIELNHCPSWCARTRFRSFQDIIIAMKV